MRRTAGVPCSEVRVVFLEVRCWVYHREFRSQHLDRLLRKRALLRVECVPQPYHLLVHRRIIRLERDSNDLARNSRAELELKAITGRTENFVVSKMVLANAMKNVTFLIDIGSIENVNLNATFS